jgi:hypothetical protein
VDLLLHEQDVRPGPVGCGIEHGPDVRDLRVVTARVRAVHSVHGVLTGGIDHDHGDAGVHAGRGAHAGNVDAARGHELA